MKKLLSSLILIMFLLVIPVAKAQTSVLVGLSGMSAFNNLSAGITAGLSVPFLHRYEFDLQDTYSPYETHVGLGQGHANIASAGGLVWLSPRWGITSKIEDSGYSVTKVSKNAIMVQGGVVTRQYFLTVPTRFGIGYAQQINNGIVNGVETSQMKAVYFSIDGRPFCGKNVCIRFQEQFSLGRVLTQGNPVCDGTFGPVPAILSCPRGSALGGGVSMNVVLDFHKNANSNELY